MSIFRPCIDIHSGQVKQIVGGTLSDHGESLQTNFVSEHSASWYAEKYQEDGLRGGHVIMLGAGNDVVAQEALSAYPHGLQVGGGINQENAQRWLEMGASHVIVTSWLFDSEGNFLKERMKSLSAEVGRERLVIDLSCRKTVDGWRVAMNRWQTLTTLPIEVGVLDDLAEYADEFLIHAADVEGKCQGIDEDLVRFLGGWQRIPMTYAGGIYRMEDFELIDALSGGSMDATVGSALDIFGGTGLRYADLVKWNRRENA